MTRVTRGARGLGELPRTARDIVDEETELLARVQAALLAHPVARPREPRDLLERLRELREQAARAAEHDLPTLFQEMGLVRALLEHPQAPALPDWRSPYFAHLRVDEGGRRTDFCLGRASFVDTAQGVRVVDWRFAPVARIYYRYREGDAYEEELPGRVAEGAIDARRVVVVRGGELTRIIAPGLTLSRDPRGPWRCSDGDAAALGGGAGRAARAGFLGVGHGATDASRRTPDLSALLDREQYDAITADGGRPLLVLGSAGSGKTTVALHRLAALAFEEPERYPPQRLQIVVPERGLARLASRLLEPLGLSQVSVKTLDAWARDRVHGAFRQPPNRLCRDAPALVVGLKRHPALYRLLGERLRGRPGPSTYGAARRELADLFTDRAFLAQVVERAGGALPATAVEETVRHTMRQLAAPTRPALVDAKEWEPVDGRSFDDGTPEELSGTVDLEDLPILLFLRAAPAGSAAPRVAHLVVDESEDISLFELSALGGLLGRERSVTLAGDEAQQTFSSFAGWDEALEALGARGAGTCRLQTTYRCPRPVADLARRLLGPLALPAPALAGRDGPPVGFFQFPSEAHAWLFLVDALRDLVEREPHASVGVVARSPEAARAFHGLFGEAGQSRLVLDGEFSFRPGIDVTEVAQVKGLEFDYVVVPDASAEAYPMSDDARRALHVAATRACHQLWIAAAGAPSPVLLQAGLR